MSLRIAALALFLLMMASPSFAVTIDFGGLGGGAAVEVTDQYLTDGVRFSGLVADDFCGGGYCGVLQDINVGGTQYNAPVTLTFESGGVMGTTENISLALADSNTGSGLVSWAAYDVNGDLIASQTVTANGGTQVVSIAATGVHQLVLSDDGDGSLLKSVDFDSVIAYEDGQQEPPHMPEPSAAVLFGIAAFALSRRTRRAR